MTFKPDKNFLSTLRDRLIESDDSEHNGLEKGTIVGDEYVVCDPVSKGGSGFIYTCNRKSEPHKMYALKITYPKSANAARRFQAEVNASYRVKHLNVLRSIDCLFHGNALAYVMEYAPGGDLRDLLDNNNEIPMRTIFVVLRQLCEGMSAIHAKNIIHRDIKPENVLFSAEGHIKIADFGISFTSDLTRITSNGALVGTINYMAPEYVKRGIFDTKSDIFSLGVLFYEIITKTLPYGYSRTLEELIVKVENAPIPLTELRAEADYQLSNVISKMISPDPEARYQTIDDVLFEIKQLEEEYLFNNDPNFDSDFEALLGDKSLSAGISVKWFNFALFLCISVILGSTMAILLYKLKIV